MSSPTFKTAWDIDYAREMMEYRVDAFLRARGWKTTCNTPGSYWLWEKEVDGASLIVGKELALSMEKNFDALRCECEEDEGDAPTCPVHCPKGVQP